jgi:hypothetical protein
MQVSVKYWMNNIETVHDEANEKEEPSAVSSGFNSPT